MKPWIKRSLTAFAGIAVVIGGLTACGRGPHERGPMDPERMAEMRAKVIQRVTRELDLTAEQQQKLNVLADKMQSQHVALMGQTTNPRAEMQALVAGAKFDRTRAQTLLDEKTRAVQAQGPQVITALADFYDSLDAKQQAEVREHMGERKRWFSRD
jgi:Spy/CpxP family protein refolding chaperone